jgi:preprotein translocase subunit SecE
MTSPVKFLQETRTELSLVVWPKKDEVVRLTGVVLITSIIVGAYIGGLDYIFTQAVSFLIGR